MSNPARPALSGEVLATPIYKVISEVGTPKRTSGEPSPLAVIIEPSQNGHREYIFMGNHPFNLHSEEGFTNAAVWATVIKFCSGADLRYGKPIDKARFMEEPMEIVPVLEGNQVGMYVERSHLLHYALTGGIWGETAEKLEEYLERNLNNTKGRERFRRILEDTIGVMPRFHTQLELPI